MLKLATLLDNPGEPQPQSRYRDPRELQKLGYNGLVIYETTGLSGIQGPEQVGTGEMRRWVERQFEQVEQTIQRADAAGLDVYIVYDTLSLARSIVEAHASSMRCKNRPQWLCPASESALERSVSGLQSLLSRWPKLAGVVLRFGDNDAMRLPYLVGNDLYTPHCPRCSHLGRVDRIALVLERFYNLVVQSQNKNLIVRAWNIRPNGMHDSAELCRRLVPRLPDDPTRSPDPRLIFSFKFTQADFWRYQPWNPSSLNLGNRPILYELQCQREFEAKGGIPNWQVPLWRDGYPECRQPDQPTGLAQASQQINLAGLWAWVRGGGWGGPFIKNETWIDANVVAVPLLADSPQADPQQLAQDWITNRLGLQGPAASAMLQILGNSPQTILQAFYIGPFARSRTDNPWHPNGDWIQDDLLDAQAAWRIIQQLPENQLDDVVREKQEAVLRLGADRAALQQAADEHNHSQLDPLINSLIYAESLLESLRDLLDGLVAYRRWQKNKQPAQAHLCKQRLLAAQSHWNHHTQRHGSMPGVATAFREETFWPLTQQILSQLP